MLGSPDRDALEALLSSARESLASEDFDTAKSISDLILDRISRIDLQEQISAEPTAYKASVVVVAYRKDDEHGQLLDVLLALPPTIYEILLIENSAEGIFDLGRSSGRENVKVLKIGMNAGIGVARNVGLRVAAGSAIIFIDDDGRTTLEDIQRLHRTFEDQEAVAVRGRVRPKTPTAEPLPPHYDMGKYLRQAICNIEGFSIWNADAVRSVGGFDPVLYGLEGAELTARLYPFAGPDAFLYEPTAVLEHDFSLDAVHAEQKMSRYEVLGRYCRHKLPDYASIRGVFRKDISGNPVAAATLASRRRFLSGAPGLSGRARENLTVISTGRNAAPFLVDFANSLAWQTDQSFELVFVDDGSDDGSVELLDRHLPREIGRRVAEPGRLGRAGALNAALDLARTEVCVIADPEDIMVAQRIAWTRAAYRYHPDPAMMGFLVFGTNSHAYAAEPLPVLPADLQVRKLFGMPAPFPGLSFRLASMEERFDEALEIGAEWDWVYRNLNRSAITGYLLPLLGAFCRNPPVRMTGPEQAIERDLESRHFRACHEEIIGAGEVPTSALERLVGWTPMTSHEDYKEVHDYGQALLRAFLDWDTPVGTEACRTVLALLETRHFQGLEADCNSSRAELTRKARSYDRLRERSATVEASLRASQREERARHRDEIKRHGEALAALGQKTAEYEREIRSCREALDARNEEIERIHRSLSMKLTSPLRYISSLLR